MHDILSEAGAEITKQPSLPPHSSPPTTANTLSVRATVQGALTFVAGAGLSIDGVWAARQGLL